MSRSKVYIVGPMTNQLFYNYEMFSAVEMMWEREGFDVKTPFELNSRVWQRHFNRPFDPYTDQCDYGDPKLAEMCAEDMAWLCESDIVAALPGWQHSKGTKMELMVALNLQKDIRDALTFSPLDLSGSITLDVVDSLFT